MNRPIILHRIGEIACCVRLILNYLFIFLNLSVHHDRNTVRLEFQRDPSSYTASDVASGRTASVII